MIENLYTPRCIRTFTGKYVNIFDPKPEMFCIEDVAHALSQIPRFGGHLPEFHSVAQHVVMVCDLVPKEFKFEALNHDDTEAYILDMPKPIKIEIPQYNDIEHKLAKFIAPIFGYKYPFSKEIHDADRAMLEAEWELLMLRKREPNFVSLEPYEAEALFLEYYHKYKPK